MEVLQNLIDIAARLMGDQRNPRFGIGTAESPGRIRGALKGGAFCFTLPLA